VTVIGVDFGTTNTVVSLLLPDGTAQTVRHRFGTAELDVVRTLLCFWNEGSGKHLALRNGVGPAAIEAYLDDPLESRLMMSLKSYLAQRSFTETRVFGRSFTLEDLIALFLRPVVPQITEGAVLVAGRPVRFAGDAADDALGERRLRRAYADIGWGQVQTALEPEAAAKVTDQHGGGSGQAAGKAVAGGLRLERRLHLPPTDVGIGPLCPQPDRPRHRADR
jgi:hypothetical chaperone protein